MIKHTIKGRKHIVEPMTEKAARFLNCFVGSVLVMSAEEFESVRMEMGAHGCWIMGER
jgi:hypothetical protein